MRNEALKLTTAQEPDSVKIEILAGYILETARGLFAQTEVQKEFNEWQKKRTKIKSQHWGKAPALTS